MNNTGFYIVKAGNEHQLYVSDIKTFKTMQTCVILNNY